MNNNTVVIFFVAILLGFACIIIWKRPWASKFVEYVAKDEMPIWLSMILAISAAVGTYYLAPLVNESFEFQKNRSTHLINTINELNKSVVDLSISVRKYNDALFYNSDDLRQKRGVLLDKIAELQWRLVDAQVIISRVRHNDQSIKKLSSSLMIMQNTVLSAKRPEDQEKVAASHVEVIKRARDSMITLYEAANIN